MTSKICLSCGFLLSLDSYYKHDHMASGYLNKCKSCVRAAATQNRNDKLEYYRAYDRARGDRHPPDYFPKYREDNPAKYSAHIAVGNAIRDGKMVKGTECESCGSPDYLHGHHDDYSKPLIVRWLCAACHKIWHRDNGAGLNA